MTGIQLTVERLVKGMLMLCSSIPMLPHVAPRPEWDNSATQTIPLLEQIHRTRYCIETEDPKRYD